MSWIHRRFCITQYWTSMLGWAFFNLLERHLKWPSSLSLSVKTAIFTRRKSLLKPRDKSCSSRHKSYCQGKASLCLSPFFSASLSFSIGGLFRLSLNALVFHLLDVSVGQRAGKAGELSSLQMYAAQSSPDDTMVRSHMELNFGKGGGLFHIWQMFMVYQRLCR